MTDTATLAVLLPVILLLFLAVATAIASRIVGLSPIVGYIALGLALRAGGVGFLFEQSTIALLAELGVIFLLFDIGLHFSLAHVRRQASDIFAFGPFQVVFATVAIGLAALAFGMDLLPALLTGAVLALSSTAVVGRLIAERHQQNCPVGLTATSILVFQDVAAIFLLIVAGALDGGGSVWIAALQALGKAVLAFAVTVAIARLLIGPLLALVARTRNEEVFTAMALLIALAAGWATGQIGLSLTLGAFLGGLALAKTPYRAVIESEIRPFRGLLLGFFFISIGLSLDVAALASSWRIVIGLTVLLLALKIVSNILASRVFRWSVPGSTQLGFLLAQGSEFAFVILSLSAVRAVIGESRASVIIAVVALSMAVTPNLADAGRKLAGRMRMRRQQQKAMIEELTPQLEAAPAIIIGMGEIGRTVADALIKFEIGYYAIERDPQRLQMAIADGYNVVFGDGADMRLWGSIQLHARKLSVLTAPDFEVLKETAPMAKMQFPNLKRFAVVSDESGLERFHGIGLQAIVDRSLPRGIDVAMEILTELEMPAAAIEEWVNEQTQFADSNPLLKSAA
ncbi:MAG TPA: cation:proton antiporter [Herbaspirillum sp.]|jgi:CPA2 family monovalent cation:H+ antiporter-2